MYSFIVVEKLQMPTRHYLLLLLFSGNPPKESRLDQSDFLKIFLEWLEKLVLDGLEHLGVRLVVGVERHEGVLEGSAAVVPRRETSVNAPRRVFLQRGGTEGHAGAQDVQQIMRRRQVNDFHSNEGLHSVQTKGFGMLEELNPTRQRRRRRGSFGNVVLVNIGQHLEKVFRGDVLGKVSDLHTILSMAQVAQGHRATGKDQLVRRNLLSFSNHKDDIRPFGILEQSRHVDSKVTHSRSRRRRRHVVVATATRSRMRSIARDDATLVRGTECRRRVEEAASASATRMRRRPEIRRAPRGAEPTTRRRGTEARGRRVRTER